MALFPGDMNTGWGFGIEPQEKMTSEEYDAQQKAYIQEKYPVLTDPLLAVSELEVKVEQLEAFRSNHQERLLWLEMHYGDMLSKQEQRVEKLEDMCSRSLFGIDQHELAFDAQYHRITDLEERLRSLCIVVNSFVETLEEKE